MLDRPPAPPERRRPTRSPSRAALAALALLAATLAAADVPEGPNLPLSRNAAGTNAGNGPSQRPAVANGGRFVAFRSSASDLLGAGADTNSLGDVFLWRAEDGGLEAVSSTNPGLALSDGPSDEPAITPDGRFVVFNSGASSLPGGNGVCQTFLLDRGDPWDPLSQRTVEVVSVADGDPPAVGNGQCPTLGQQPSVSDDGRFVGFSSNSSNLVADDLQTDLVNKRWQVFVRDRELDRTYRLPDPADPAEESPDASSYEVRLDASGRRAVFSSAARDIPLGDFDFLIDLFVWELPEDGGRPRITQRIDADASGTPLRFELSGDGRWLVLVTRAPLDPADEADTSDLYLVALDGSEPPRRLPTPASVGELSISHDGRFVAMSGSQGLYSNIWVWDARAGELREVGFRTNGNSARGAGAPAISPDGRSVAFHSPDSALAPEYDSNNKSDVYLLVDALAVLDPQPHLKSGIDAVLGDLSLLGSGALPWVRGLATDGATRAVLRFLPREETGAVRFRLLDEGGGSDHVGGLAARTASVAAPLTDLTVPVEALPSGQLAAFAQWLAPDRFAREPPPATPEALDCDLEPGADRCRAVRPAIVEISYTPVGDDPVTLTRELDLVRPPLALLHGIWGDRTTWKWSLLDDPRFTIHRQDYAPTNAEPFAVNLDEPPKAVEGALDRARAAGIAATQADLVGHSMGGVLSRLHLARTLPLPRGPENFDAGTIRSLATVGSPLHGAVLACLLRELISTPIFGPRFKAVFERTEGCTDCGAVDDLEPGSVPLRRIPASTDSSVHAVLGVGGPDWVAAFAPPFLPTPILIESSLRFFGLTFDDLFGPGERHDLIVRESSQTGGLAPQHQTAFGFDDPPEEQGVHLTQTKEDRFGEAIAWLADLPRDHPALADGFPQAQTFACDPILPFAAAPAARPATASGLGITITEPASGAVVAPGDTLQVTVEPTGGLAPEAVLVLAPDHSEVLEVPPFTTAFTVPIEALGGATVAAVARDTAGTLHAAEVAISIETSEALDSLRLEPALLALGPRGPAGRLRLLGLFDSGVERDLSDPSFGATYETVAPSVATVDGSGRVVARRGGRTVVLAQLGVLQADARIVVEGPGPFLDGPYPARPGSLNEFRVSGASPGASIQVFRGLDPGTTSPPGCPETALDLEAAVEVASGLADAVGQAVLSTTIPSTDAGHTVFHQALDATACAVSARLDVAYGNQDRIGPAAPIEPRGPLFDPDPLFFWSALVGATDYDVEVLDGDAAIDGDSVDPAAACDASTCETDLDPLSPAAYAWRVRTTDLHGRGPWSEEVDFEILACDPPPGTVVPPGDVTGQVLHSDCQSVTAGAGVRVTTGGQLELHGGEWVMLAEGFSVDAGGTLTVRVDRSGVAP